MRRRRREGAKNKSIFYSLNIYSYSIKTVEKKTERWSEGYRRELRCVPQRIWRAESHVLACRWSPPSLRWQHHSSSHEQLGYWMPLQIQRMDEGVFVFLSVSLCSICNSKHFYLCLECKFRKIYFLFPLSCKYWNIQMCLTNWRFTVLDNRSNLFSQSNLHYLLNSDFTY